jgi:hypothetical protein
MFAIEEGMILAPAYPGIGLDLTRTRSRGSGSVADRGRAGEEPEVVRGRPAGY